MVLTHYNLRNGSSPVGGFGKGLLDGWLRFQPALAIPDLLLVEQAFGLNAGAAPAIGPNHDVGFLC